MTVVESLRDRDDSLRAAMRMLLVGSGGLGLMGCIAQDPTPVDPCITGQGDCAQQVLTPIDDCPTVAASGNPELDAAYTEVRAMHFYRYGDHPYCEATSHIMAYKGVVEHDLGLRKLIIDFREPYQSACGREPMFSWHTVAALPSAQAAGGYLVLDPVYRCGIDSLADYLQWYVKTDCPEFSGEFAGCVTMSEDEWFVSRSVDATAPCVVIDVEPWHYDLFNCSSNLGEPWDQARLERAFSYVRTDLTGTSDYASRPGASMNDYRCDFAQSSDPDSTPIPPSLLVPGSAER